ncbi:MAG: hypothetical protein M1820_010702 [Bogoriella megaspora]|nr:MAG: hypothetical protein M1820_010702 [Bogoriella megaspora]
MRRPSRQGVAGNPGLSDYAVHFFSYHLSKCHSSDNGAMKNLGSFLNSKILAWIEHVAKNGDLSPFSRTAADLKTYLNRRERHVPPTDPNMQTAEAWTTDLVRIAGKFGKYLLASPSSIHSLIPSLCPSASVIRRAFFNPNRSLIVKGIAAQDWDDCLARLDFPDGQALAIAHGESVFAVGLSNGFVEVFSKAILQLKKRLSHGERVKTLNFGKQDRYIASGGSRKICLWDAKNYTLIWSEKQDCQILALQFASNDYLLGITQRHEMVSWATESPHEDQERRLTIPLDFPMENKPKQPPTKALFSTDQRFFVLAYRAQAPFLFETETASVLSRLNRENGSPYPNAVLRHEVDVEALAFNPNPDLDLLIVSYGDGELVTFNLELYQACHRVPGVYAHTLACSPDGGTLVSGSSRGTIQVFEFDGVRGDNLTPIYRIDAFEDGIRGITFGSESNRFLDVRSSQCRVWEPPMLVRRGGAEGSQSEMTLSMPLQPRTVGMLEGPPDPEITSVLSSHDGGRAICGKQDGSIIVHSTSDAKQIAKAYSHHPNVSVTCLALTESDAVLISADESGRILVQQTPSADLSNPAELLADERFDRAVLALLVNHGGNRLLVCGADHLELRELPSGRKLNDRFFDVQHPLRAMRHPLYQEHLIVFENDVARLLQWSDFGEVSTPGGMRLSRFTEFPRNGAALTTSYNGYHILTELAKVTGHRSNSRFECWNASEFETSTQSVITLSGFKLLGPKIEQMIAVIGNTLIFLDTDLWICSLDLKMFEAMPVMKRHFFVLSEWLTMSGELLCNFTRKREFVIAKKHELVIVKHGMDFAETLELSTATKLWTLSQGSMHRKTSYNLST